MINIINSDAILSDFIQSMGPWNEHVIIGGGYALIIYKLYLAQKTKGNPPIGTTDIDSLISRKVPNISKRNLGRHLADSGFRSFYKNYENPATEAYLKEIKGFDIEIEFLTDNCSRFNKYDNIPIAGIVAQPLRYLNLSLNHAVEFQTHIGERGKVVSPEAWIFHKGLTFLSRSSKMKTYKDLYSIWYAASQLDTFLRKAIDDLKILATESPKWFTTFKANLEKWIDKASPADWIKLESQDPHGELREPFFRRTINMLCS